MTIEEIGEQLKKVIKFTVLAAKYENREKGILGKIYEGKAHNYINELLETIQQYATEAFEKGYKTKEAEKNIARDSDNNIYELKEK